MEVYMVSKYKITFEVECHLNTGNYVLGEHKGVRSVLKMNEGSLEVHIADLPPMNIPTLREWVIRFIEARPGACLVTLVNWKGYPPSHHRVRVGWSSQGEWFDPYGVSHPNEDC